MSRLIWDETGDRLYETGVDRGVLYSSEAPAGVAWDGLVSVTESPSGGEASAQYSDNFKYLNLISTEELGGTIEAFSYPNEFSVCDGTWSPIPGLFIGQQTRKLFGLSYRTRIGDDLDGIDYGYKIHLIYNALASPTEKAHGTVSDSPEAITFSWSFTTTPVSMGGLSQPTSHLTIDSTKVNATTLSAIEGYLYGTETQAPRLITPVDLLALVSNGSIDSAQSVEDPNSMKLSMVFDSATNSFAVSSGKSNDLVASSTDGIYSIPTGSRLTETADAGIYTVGVPQGVVDYPFDSTPTGWYTNPVTSLTAVSGNLKLPVTSSYLTIASPDVVDLTKSSVTWSLAALPPLAMGSSDVFIGVAIDPATGRDSLGVTLNNTSNPWTDIRLVNSGVRSVDGFAGQNRTLGSYRFGTDPDTGNLIAEYSSDGAVWIKLWSGPSPWNLTAVRPIIVEGHWNGSEADDFMLVSELKIS